MASVVGVEPAVFDHAPHGLLDQAMRNAGVVADLLGTGALVLAQVARRAIQDGYQWVVDVDLECVRRVDWLARSVKRKMLRPS